MHDPAPVTTFLFTDIEGSSRLWDREPERMRAALARHDSIARSIVEEGGGLVVKMTGDGIYAAFPDPADAVAAGLRLQHALVDPAATGGVALGVRTGIHAGVCERRDGDFFGTAVNRAARIMNAAHGGQVLISLAVASLAADRLPPGVTLRDLGPIRLRDLETPEHVYQLVHPDLRSDFPALRSIDATPNNLPRQLTSFVGREAELREVASLLRQTRLLTLTGMGGLGKTRLSLQAAADALDDYPDGVWLVELALLRNETLVPQVVAFVLGVKEEAGRPVVEALTKYVRDRRLLLILDNCEHLVRACANLAKTLLQAGPRVTLLATSRENMRIAGETTYAVPALSVPARDPTSDLDALRSCEAVRLFVERAAAARPGFELTTRNALSVAAICRRLDGIPLALELAAARVRTLSVDAIAERLADRFHLLTGGDRTGVAHHQTLRELIDWSHDLLSEPERLLLRRLAVFEGGWTLDAAEAVVGGDDLGREAVLDLLTRLVEKSLVTFSTDSERYGMLETVREYADEKLKGPERDAARARHLGYYVAFAEQARPGLLGSEQGVWLRRIDAELENLLAAHASCDRVEGGSALGLRLAYAVKPYWLNRGLLALGHRVTDEALQREPARSLARCRGLADAGQLSYFMGRYDGARRYLEESLDIARELGDTRTIAAVLQPLGMVCLGQGDTATARDHLAEGLSLAEQLGNKREIAAAANALAQLHRMNDDLDAAEPLYQRALAVVSELGDREFVAIALLNLAMVAIVRDAADRARSLLIEVHAIAQEIGSRAAGQSMLDVCAALAAQRGEWECAARFYGAAEAQTGQTGLHRDPADDAFIAPLIARARAGCAAEVFAAAEAAGRALSYEQATAAAQSWLRGVASSDPLSCSSLWDPSR